MAETASSSPEKGYDQANGTSDASQRISDTTIAGQDADAEAGQTAQIGKENKEGIKEEEEEEEDVPPDGGYGWVCVACVRLPITTNLTSSPPPIHKPLH